VTDPTISEAAREPAAATAGQTRIATIPEHRVAPAWSGLRR
jgi:hypothetical protein